MVMQIRKRLPVSDNKSLYRVLMLKHFLENQLNMSTVNSLPMKDQLFGKRSRLLTNRMMFEGDDIYRDSTAITKCECLILTTK